MAEAVAGAVGKTEISERSTELILPSVPGGAVEAPASAPPPSAGMSSSAGTSTPASTPTARLGERKSALIDPGTRVVEGSSQPEQRTEFEKGAALPGDRGPRTRSVEPAKEAQRPSFWRRISLGGRRAQEPVVETKPTIRHDALAKPDMSATAEQRIVEPLLQALVSVEAKLERSHIELTKRSDQIEQRLTQLWDIEDQLGTLGELQETLLKISEQQKRVSTAVETQARTLRWLIGSIFFALAAAAFVVAAVLR